jgi:hypothetical protein
MLLQENVTMRIELVLDVRCECSVARIDAAHS